MMPQFGTRSKSVRATLRPELQEIVDTAIQVFDFSLISGHRGAEEQNALFDKGFSKLNFPESKHNTDPSSAFDAAPYFADKIPHINWKNRDAFILMAGVMLTCAFIRGYELRWGGDWDSDFDMQDQTFNDLGHFELVV